MLWKQKSETLNLGKGVRENIELRLKDELESKNQHVERNEI